MATADNPSNAVIVALKARLDKKVFGSNASTTNPKTVNAATILAQWPLLRMLRIGFLSFMIWPALEIIPYRHNGVSPRINHKINLLNFFIIMPYENLNLFPVACYGTFSFSLVFSFSQIFETIDEINVSENKPIEKFSDLSRFLP